MSDLIAMMQTPWGTFDVPPHVAEAERRERWVERGAADHLHHGPTFDAWLAKVYADAHAAWEAGDRLPGDAFMEWQA